MSLNSAFYIGKVWHRRWKPQRHSLDYRVYSLYCDLDELPELSRRFRLFSHNRFNLFSLQDRDFGPGDGTALRPWVEEQLAAAGLESKGISIGLLAYPKLLGYAFNPLSVFFCRRAEDGGLVALLYEVHNTFGERHCYLIAANPSQPIARHGCEKEFYVSPFIAMRAHYRFRVLPPAPVRRADDRLSISIHECDQEGRLLDATFVATRAELGDMKFLSLLASHPLMTLKVIAGIHWEAVKLWLKGVRLVDRPPPPAHLITIVPRNTETRHEHEPPVHSAV
ncbi:MAG: DUF1365 domain-containing protein [Rhodospirillaceae bacterium]|nr:DUF1365 domain-containing protein [Rhodospirillaceae bacterium]